MKTHRIKVLIIDGDEDVLIAFERLLEDEGYDTTTACTGQDALKALQNQVFSLVLVNEYLQDMDAEFFISELRRRGGNVPCIVIQTSAQITDICRFLAAGAVAVVCEWSQTKVLEAVYAHVSPTSTMPACLGVLSNGGHVAASDAQEEQEQHGNLDRSQIYTRGTHVSAADDYRLSLDVQG